MSICPTISHTWLPYLPSRWVLLFVSDVVERKQDAEWISFIIFHKILKPSWGLWYWIVQSPSGYLFVFQFWYCILCVENGCGRDRGHCFLQFLYFGGALIVRRWGVLGWGRNSYLEPRSVHSLLSAGGGGGWNSYQIFKEGFSVITKNSNWEI